MHMYVCLHQRSEIQKFNITDRARTTNAIRRLACVGVSSRRKPLLALVRYFHISSTMRAGMAAAATLLFCGTSADAFVSPSAFAGTGVRAGSREALSFATARAAGAMRSRPTMSVLDVSPMCTIHPLSHSSMCGAFRRRLTGTTSSPFNHEKCGTR